VKGQEHLQQGVRIKGKQSCSTRERKRTPTAKLSGQSHSISVRTKAPTTTNKGIFSHYHTTNNYKDNFTGQDHLQPKIKEIIKDYQEEGKKRVKTPATTF
jgi:hypothetical protein